MISLRASVLALCGMLFTSGCVRYQPSSTIDTPDLRWKAALEAFAQGDVKKTDEHLKWLTETDNPFVQQARSWRLVMLSGTARAYMELLDRYLKAAAGGPSNPLQLQRDIDALRQVTAEHGFTLGQAHADFQKAYPEGEVILSFPIPPFVNMTTPAGLERFPLSTPPTGPQADALELATLRWGITHAICEIAGSPDNLEQTKQLFKTLPVRLPRAIFELGMASGMFQVSPVFGPTLLDNRQRYASILYQARIAVGKGPAGPETGALSTKIQEALAPKR